MRPIIEHARTRGNDPSESDKLEADVIAEALALAATEIGEVCSELSGRACRGLWRWPYGRAALEQLEQDMAVLRAKLEDARDMSWDARIVPHPSAPVIPPRMRGGMLDETAKIMLDAAAGAAVLVADHSGQQLDRLKADLLAAIAADDLPRAVAVLAGLTRHKNARSA